MARASPPGVKNRTHGDSVCADLEVRGQRTVDFGVLACLNHLLQCTCVHVPSPLSPAADPVGSDARMKFLRGLWHARLRGAQKQVDVWQALLTIHRWEGGA